MWLVRGLCVTNRSVNQISDSIHRTAKSSTSLLTLSRKHSAALLAIGMTILRHLTRGDIDHTRSIAEHNHIQILASNESGVAIWPPTRLGRLLSAVSCRHALGRPQRSQLSRATTFLGCRLLVPGDVVCERPVSKSPPQGVILRRVTKGLPAAPISHPTTSAPSPSCEGPAAVG